MAVTTSSAEQVRRRLHAAKWLLDDVQGTAEHAAVSRGQSDLVMAMLGRTAAHGVLTAQQVCKLNALQVSLEIWRELSTQMLANLAHQATTVRRELPTSSSCRAQPVDTAQQERQ